MMRRVMQAVVICASAWIVLGSAAGAQTYPPTPLAPPTRNPIVSPLVPPPVVVQATPASPQRALGRTGGSHTLPLIALATGSVLVGVTLVGTARRRAMPSPGGP